MTGNCLLASAVAGETLKVKKLSFESTAGWKLAEWVDYGKSSRN
jgi:hypothetical protein